MIRVYGIRQCDTCRKALKWLNSEGVDHEWIDLRESPVDEPTLARWWQALGAALVNRRSTTWRQLEPAQQQLDDEAMVVALLGQFPTLIKRPLVQWADGYSVGFDAAQWRERSRS